MYWLKFSWLAMGKVMAWYKLAQAITWTDDNYDLWLHMASHGWVG